MSFRCEVHPVYGAVPRDGETVEEGDIIGLSIDGSGTITAPHAGVARVTHSQEGELRRTFIEIALAVLPPEIE